jgi:FKBP-type peptidyl-prolyl cis-trans isomerase FklB
MKFFFVILMGLCLLVSPVMAAENGTLKSQKDKVSYTLGADVAKSLKQLGVEVDPEIFIKGVKDALTGAKPLLTEEEMRNVMTTFKQEMGAKQMEKIKALGEKNKKDGEAFLAENKKKPGVKTTASGLQYKVIKEGTGKTPKKTDKVSCNYQGTLIDGTEFDSSYKRGQPATFPVEGVIPAWTEALQMMKVGSKWQLFVPAKLGYGEKGAGPLIGPNAVLIFTVELMSIPDGK